MSFSAVKIIWVAVSLLCLTTADVRNETKPNIVIMLMDDVSLEKFYFYFALTFI